MRLFRQLLLLLLVLGSTISLLTSGRLTIRLIADGAASFAFVPVCEVVGIAVLWTRWRLQRRFGQTVHELLANNQPWLYWLLALGAIGAFVPVADVGFWLAPALFSTAIPVLWAGWLDFSWPRRQRPGIARALGDVVLLRAAAWSLAFVYFFGAVLFSDVVPMVSGWIGR